jgi:UDP-4-amino-4,6-dideoxy-N-acetyl-beta-L-altrosamine N-acetyltransferase
MFDACRIRLLRGEELPMLLSWRNHPEVRRFMFTQHEIGFLEHRQWFDRVSQDFSRRLLIVEEAQTPIGYVQFANVTDGGIADWGFYARPNAVKGTGQKIGKTALNYAFKLLNLHKVCGQAIETNHVSIDFHAKLGFTKEAFLRDQKKINGEYLSLICFGLLAKEWHL